MPECIQESIPAPWASLRKYEMGQRALLEVPQRRCLPTSVSPVSCPLCRCKHATKWSETTVNQLCSCFITLLISIIISVGFLFQSVGLEVQFVQTLVFGKGICEPAQRSLPCLFLHGIMQDSSSNPRQQAERRGSSQATFHRPNRRG